MPQKKRPNASLRGDQANAGQGHACANCGLKFRPIRKKQKFCSANCRRRAFDKQKIIRTLIEALNRTIGELQK